MDGMMNTLKCTTGCGALRLEEPNKLHEKPETTTQPDTDPSTLSTFDLSSRPDIDFDWDYPYLSYPDLYLWD